MSGDSSVPDSEGSPQIALRPVSIEGSVVLNVAGMVAALSLFRTC